MPKRGLIKLSSKILLQWLQFDDLGEIRGVSFDAFQDCLDIVLEHLEMPEVEEGCAIETVMPRYTCHQDNMGNKVVIREKLNACKK